MRIRDITEGVGRITKQNQTHDVGPDEVTKQAAKFGNKVDKDGRPPTLSKKVKGSSTNVLFNLGMTEGYKLQLERDKELLVLNITDTKTGKRTEVRGKPGYETGGYDPKDSLHILLDKVGKSVDISQLMNGEPVGINPKHPKGASAKAATDTAFNEALDNPYPYTWELEQEDYQVAAAPLPNDSGLDVTFDNTDNNWFIDFSVDFSQDKTGAGDEFRIFATVVAVIKDWWKNKFDKKADSIVWSGSKREEEGNSRVKLYKRFAQQMASQTGWKLEITDGGSADLFKLSNPNPTPRDDESDNNVEENFADGKVKGKSKPGRVKKSGASCNGTVTQLRKRAKNASGEKAKMYHWCANMKGGKK
jgi:hypothetical protein